MKVKNFIREFIVEEDRGFDSAEQGMSLRAGREELPGTH